MEHFSRCHRGVPLIAKLGWHWNCITQGLEIVLEAFGGIGIPASCRWAQPAKQPHAVKHCTPEPHSAHFQKQRFWKAVGPRFGVFTCGCPPRAQIPIIQVIDLQGTRRSVFGFAPDFVGAQSRQRGPSHAYGNHIQRRNPISDLTHFMLVIFFVPIPLRACSRCDDSSSKKALASGFVLIFPTVEQ